MDVESELKALLIGLTDSDLAAYQKVLDTIVANSEHQSTPSEQYYK
jgi:hypothetical protein